MKWWDQMPWISFFECWVKATFFTLLFHFHQEALDLLNGSYQNIELDILTPNGLHWVREILGIKMRDSNVGTKGRKKNQTKNRHVVLQNKIQPRKFLKSSWLHWVIYKSDSVPSSNLKSTERDRFLKGWHWSRPAFECLSVSYWGTGQQWPVVGTGPLAAPILGGAACGISPLRRGHH